MTDLLDPKNDFVFKRIFGSEENKDVLLAFLNRTFEDAGRPRLTEIVLLNPYTDKDAPDDKQSILDICARADDGTLVNVEIQLFNRYDIEKRTLFYWAKLYTSQLAEGEQYRKLRRTVAINILNFAFLPNAQVHNVFHLKEDRTGIGLTDDLELHFMELPKLREEEVPVEGGLTSWLLFLKGIEREQWEVLAMQEPALKKAMTTLEILSQSEEARWRYEARQKFLRDQASMLEGAREEGRAEGLQQGLQKGELKKAEEVARNLLARGMDADTVAEVTGLPPERVHAWTNEAR